MRPKILLLGANGQIGWELQRTLAPLGKLVCATRTGEYGLCVDLADHSGLLSVLHSISPDLVVNAAAYTAVDRAETEPERAMQINGKAPSIIGAWAADRGVCVIHYSTDYVFDGTKDGAYVETDTPNPLGVYGRTKLAGDEALLISDAAVVILRVGWVYGQRGDNFLNTMRRLMRERERLQVVNDQFGVPTWSRAIAEATAQVAARLSCTDIKDAHKPCGIYHLSPASSTTWFGFAQAIRQQGQYPCAIQPISSADYPTPARRPANTRLDAQKLALDTAIQLPDWTELFALCMDE